MKNTLLNSLVLVVILVAISCNVKIVSSKTTLSNVQYIHAIRDIIEGLIKSLATRQKIEKNKKVELQEYRKAHQQRLGTDVLICRLCKEIFVDPDKYFDHAHFHVVEKLQLALTTNINIKCKLCDYSYNNKYDYYKHCYHEHLEQNIDKLTTPVQTTTTEKQNNYADELYCKVCNITILYKEKFYIHSYKHLEENMDLIVINTLDNNEQRLTETINTVSNEIINDKDKIIERNLNDNVDYNNNGDDNINKSKNKFENNIEIDNDTNESNKNSKRKCKRNVEVLNESRSNKYNQRTTEQGKVNSQDQVKTDQVNTKDQVKTSNEILKDYHINTDTILLETNPTLITRNIKTTLSYEQKMELYKKLKINHKITESIYKIRYNDKLKNDQREENIINSELNNTGKKINDSPERIIRDSKEINNTGEKINDSPRRMIRDSKEINNNTESNINFKKTINDSPRESKEIKNNTEEFVSFRKKYTPRELKETMSNIKSIKSFSTKFPKYAVNDIKYHANNLLYKVKKKDPQAEILYLVKFNKNAHLQMVLSKQYKAVNDLYLALDHTIHGLETSTQTNQQNNIILNNTSNHNVKNEKMKVDREFITDFSNNYYSSDNTYYFTRSTRRNRNMYKNYENATLYSTLINYFYKNIKYNYYKNFTTTCKTSYYKNNRNLYKNCNNATIYFTVINNNTFYINRNFTYPKLSSKIYHNRNLYKNFNYLNKNYSNILPYYYYKSKRNNRTTSIIENKGMNRSVNNEQSKLDTLQTSLKNRKKRNIQDENSMNAINKTITQNDNDVVKNNIIKEQTNIEDNSTIRIYQPTVSRFIEKLFQTQTRIVRITKDLRTTRKITWTPYTGHQEFTGDMFDGPSGEHRFSLMMRDFRSTKLYLKCPWCPRRFWYNAELLSHIQNHNLSHVYPEATFDIPTVSTKKYEATYADRDIDDFVSNFQTFTYSYGTQPNEGDFGPEFTLHITSSTPTTTVETTTFSYAAVSEMMGKILDPGYLAGMFTTGAPTPDPKYTRNIDFLYRERTFLTPKPTIPNIYQCAQMLDSFRNELRKMATDLAKNESYTDSSEQNITSTTELNEMKKGIKIEEIKENTTEKWFNKMFNLIKNKTSGRERKQTERTYRKKTVPWTKLAATEMEYEDSEVTSTTKETILTTPVDFYNQFINSIKNKTDEIKNTKTTDVFNKFIKSLSNIKEEENIKKEMEEKERIRKEKAFEERLRRYEAKIDHKNTPLMIHERDLRKYVDEDKEKNDRIAKIHEMLVKNDVRELIYNNTSPMAAYDDRKMNDKLDGMLDEGGTKDDDYYKDMYETVTMYQDDPRQFENEPPTYSTLPSYTSIRPPGFF